MSKCLKCLLHVVKPAQIILCISFSDNSSANILTFSCSPPRLCSGGATDSICMGHELRLLNITADFMWRLLPNWWFARRITRRQVCDWSVLQMFCFIVSQDVFCICSTQVPMFAYWPVLLVSEWVKTSSHTVPGGKSSPKETAALGGCNTGSPLNLKG